MTLTHLPVFVTGAIVVGLLSWNLSYYESNGSVLARTGPANQHSHGQVAGLEAKRAREDAYGLRPGASIWPKEELVDQILARSPGATRAAKGAPGSVDDSTADALAASGVDANGRSFHQIGRHLAPDKQRGEGLGDLRRGESRAFYANGEPRWIGFTLDGEKDGHTLEFSEDGELIAEGRYESGERVGQWVTWYPSGQKLDEGSYDTSGAREGEWLAWNEQGTLVKSGTFASGTKAGLFEEWYSDGDLRSRGQFVSGLREGYWTFYDPDGSLDRRSGVYEGGARER